MSHIFTYQQTCDQCGISMHTLYTENRSRKVTIRRNAFRWDWTFYVGPWAGRLVLGPGRFFWREGDGWFTRFIRRWWTGWHKWTEECIW